MSTAGRRRTAAERREQVLDAAFELFAEHGLSASTDEIARAAGISQPYLFRLFRTKKELFIAATERCFQDTLEAFQAAAEGKTGDAALEAMGEAYGELIRTNPSCLRGQLQSYAACDDPDVREAVRRRWGELVEYVEQVSGVDPDRLSMFFSRGMLINVVMAMDLLTADEPWVRKLLSFSAK